jgi:hypothetical protein
MKFGGVNSSEQWPDDQLLSCTPKQTATHGFIYVSLVTGSQTWNTNDILHCGHSPSFANITLPGIGGGGSEGNCTGGGWFMFGKDFDNEQTGQHSCRKGSNIEYSNLFPAFLYSKSVSHLEPFS